MPRALLDGNEMCLRLGGRTAGLKDGLDKGENKNGNSFARWLEKCSEKVRWETAE
jgi:hypothetical protein